MCVITRFTGQSPKNVAEELPECPICKDGFKDPRLLECMHTFCMRCIRGICKGKSIGDKVLCPTCRNTSEIQPDGLVYNASNTLIPKLVDCENVESLEDTKSGSSKDACVKHRTDCHYFCYNCNIGFCVLCNPVPHRGPGHQCSNVQTVNERHRHRMSVDISTVAENIGKSTALAERLTSVQEQFMERIALVESSVYDRYDLLKATLVSHKELAIQQLISIKDNVESQVMNAKKVVENHVAQLESMKEKMENFMQERTHPVEFFVHADATHEKVLRLVRFDEIHTQIYKLQTFELSFHPSDVQADESNNMIGNIYARHSKGW